MQIAKDDKGRRKNYAFLISAYLNLSKPNTTEPLNIYIYKKTYVQLYIYSSIIPEKIRLSNDHHSLCVSAKAKYPGAR